MGFEKHPGPSATPKTRVIFGKSPSLSTMTNPKRIPVAAVQRNEEQTLRQPQRLGTHTDEQFENRTAEHSKNVRSPPRTPSYMRLENGTAKRSKRTRSSHLAIGSDLVQNLNSSHNESRRPVVSPRRLANQRKSPANLANSRHQRRFLPVGYSDILDKVSVQHDSKREMNLKAKRLARFNVGNGTTECSKRGRSPLGTHTLENENDKCSKRMKSPSLAFENHIVQNLNSSHKEAQRFHPVDYSDGNDVGILSPCKSPPLPSATVSMGTSSAQPDFEREMKLRAKLLPRFNVQLSQPMGNVHDVARQKSSGTKYDQAPLYKMNAGDCIEEAKNLGTGSILSDNDGLESSPVVFGLCPDMCPESKRKDCGRKGDLDKYECLERSQARKFFAVEKYRTVEREVDLIRPMAVLLKTVDFLLCLLDQPDNDNFESICNFLWDRMRTIRMDLTVQHILNREAIAMLEQMIRLNIIGMRKLCGYKKGKCFSEGFDARLKIKQMNTTSSELFQMYGNPEFLSARDVARACRIGTIFFRLSRKVTYLHFSKVRTLALAPLHSGLKHNQATPTPHATKWLGLEGENIESHWSMIVKSKDRDISLDDMVVDQGAGSSETETLASSMDDKAGAAATQIEKESPSLSEPMEDRARLAAFREELIASQKILAALVERCSRVQDKIDETLWFYF